jgi:hypothetical protein
MYEWTRWKLRNTTVVGISRIYHSLIILITIPGEQSPSCDMDSPSLDKFSACYGTRRLIDVFKGSRHCTVSRATWIQFTSSWIQFTSSCNFPLSSVVLLFFCVSGPLRCLPNRSLSRRFSDWNVVCICPTWGMSSSSHSAWPNTPHQNLRVEDMKQL